MASGTAGPHAPSAAASAAPSTGAPYRSSSRHHHDRAHHGPQRFAVPGREVRPRVVHPAAGQPGEVGQRDPAATALDGPGQFDVLDHRGADGAVAAGAVVPGPGHHQELPAGGGQ